MVSSSAIASADDASPNARTSRAGTATTNSSRTWLGEGDVARHLVGLKVTFHKQGRYWTVRLHPKVLFGQFSGDSLHRKPGYPHQAQPARTAVCGPVCTVAWQPLLIELGGSFPLRRHPLELPLRLESGRPSYWFFGRVSFLRSHNVLATPFRSGLRSPFPAWPICLRLSALECLNSPADCVT